MIDAAGYGVPTVARDVPGLRDSVRTGVTGWLVPDSADLEEVGRRLSDQVRDALGELAEPETVALTVQGLPGRLGRASSALARHQHDVGRDLVAGEHHRVRAGHTEREK